MAVDDRQTAREVEARFGLEGFGLGLRGACVGVRFGIVEVLVRQPGFVSKSVLGSARQLGVFFARKLIAICVVFLLRPFRTDARNGARLD